MRGNAKEKEMGGHFYLASHGIRVESSSNYLAIWAPEEYHATSLQCIPYSEKNGPVIQSGLAIVTSSRLPKIFKKYMEGQISEAELSSVWEGDKDSAVVYTL